MSRTHDILASDVCIIPPFLGFVKRFFEVFAFFCFSIFIFGLNVVIFTKNMKFEASQPSFRKFTDDYRV